MYSVQYRLYTGFDQVGKFSNITKSRALAAYLDSRPNQQHLAAWYEINQVTDNISKGVTRYTSLLYAKMKKKQDRDVISKFSDTGELRWLIYYKNQQETGILAPTPGALKFHVQRSNYVCGLWKVLITQFDPEVPSPCWKEEDGQLIVIMTDQLPAPEYYIEISAQCMSKDPIHQGNMRFFSRWSQVYGPVQAFRLFLR